MTFQVLLTDDASRDLEELYNYIESHDAPGKAAYVLEQLECPWLGRNPRNRYDRRASIGTRSAWTYRRLAHR